jgi:hypothetical protein
MFNLHAMFIELILNNGLSFIDIQTYIRVRTKFNVTRHTNSLIM